MTLVEIMVVVTLSSIILGVVVSLLLALQQWDRNLRDHSVYSEQLARLAETIRADIRQGTEVLLPTKETLVITSPESTQTRYEVDRAGCRRIVGMVGEARPRTDLFAIGPAASWKVDQGLPGSRPLFVVTLERAAAGSDHKSQVAPLLVYGVLGADLPTSIGPITDE